MWRTFGLVFNSAFNTCSVISRRFLGKLPLLLVHLSIYPTPCSQSGVILSPLPQPWAPRSYYHFIEIWYDPSRDRTHEFPHPRWMLYHYTIEAGRVPVQERQQWTDQRNIIEIPLKTALISNNKLLLYTSFLSARQMAIYYFSRTAMRKPTMVKL